MSATTPPRKPRRRASTAASVARTEMADPNHPSKLDFADFLKTAGKNFEIRVKLNNRPDLIPEINTIAQAVSLRQGLELTEAQEAQLVELVAKHDELVEEFERDVTWFSFRRRTEDLEARIEKKRADLGLTETFDVEVDGKIETQVRDVDPDDKTTQRMFFVLEAACTSHDFTWEQWRDLEPVIGTGQFWNVVGRFAGAYIGGDVQPVPFSHLRSVTPEPKKSDDASEPASESVAP